MGPIRRIAEKRGVPLVDLMLQTIKRMGRRATLLAICPTSEAVTKAAIQAAREHDAPILYAATLNQVDLDGGYTGWTPRDLVARVEAYTKELSFKGDAAVCSDHCGPYCKDIHTIEKWPIGPAMWGVSASVVAAMQAGYDLLHIDPTTDRTLPPGEAIKIETVIDRTVALISAVERARRAAGYPRIGYEVGTEEVHGGLADLSTFRKFLDGLKAGLSRAGLSDAWPAFVVGKVGTDLHTTYFDPSVAQHLVKAAAGYGSFIKGHYTDYCANLEAYPASGMGGANVGPEFTEVEYKALMALADDEEQLVKSGKAQPSNFKETLTKAVVDSGRWKKWLQPGEAGRDFAQLEASRREWLIETGCRYVWTAGEVASARLKLYSNLDSNGIDAEPRVVKAVAEAIGKYVDKFNLAGLNGEIAKTLRKKDAGI